VTARKVYDFKVVDVDLEPEQPRPVEAALEQLLAGPPHPDPWWQAGIDEALET
jgi:hypothetical protein